MALPAGSASEATRAGGTYQYAIPAPFFDSIDPYLSSVAPTAPLFAATCGRLLNFPDKPLPAGLRLRGEVATGYRVSRDRKTYTFPIRPGLRFSTGAALTARDAAAAFRRALDPRLQSWAAASLLDIVGAPAYLAGKTKALAGVAVKNGAVVVRLTRPVGGFPARSAGLCVMPADLPIDPEGVHVPVPSAGPYAIAEYAPGQRIVLARNRFYRGPRPHHVDTIVVTLVPDVNAILDGIESGRYDSGFVPNQFFGDRADQLRTRYGVNKSQFFVQPGLFLRLLVLNTSRPLFQDNAPLRRAVNFAIDRKALLRERGPMAGYLTDQYLMPATPGYRNVHIYPLTHADVARARRLATGHLREGKAVFYGPANAVGAAQAQIVKNNLKLINMDVDVRLFPFPVLVQKLATPGEPFDIGWIGWSLSAPDPDILDFLADGRTIGRPGSGDLSYFNSPQYNRLFDRGNRLVGRARFRFYGRLDVQLARDAAPAVAYAYDNTLTLVSKRTGCVVVNPTLDLAAVCLR